MEKLNNGDYQVAKNFLTEALKNNSSKIETYLKLANIALQEKNENLAINYYLDLLDTHPEFIDVVLSLGKIYVIRNMNAAAMNILDKLYTKYPNNIEVQMDYLKCKTLVTDYDDPEQTSALIKEYKKLPNHDENPTFNYNVASYYARIGDIDKAYTACKKALKLSPRDFEANKLCGLILIIKHDYEGAKKHLGRALRSNDKNDEVQNLISYIVCQSNSRDELQKQREKYFEFIRKS